MEKIIIDNVKAKRNQFILNELKEGIYYNKARIRRDYFYFLEGLSVGLNMELSSLEHELDKQTLGSHDLKLLLEFNSQKSLYKLIRRT